MVSGAGIGPVTDDDGDYENCNHGKEVDLVESLWECGDCDPPFGRGRKAKSRTQIGRETP